MTLELETERMRLRQLRESDHEVLAQNHADPELTRFLCGPVTPAESWRWLLSMLGHWRMRGFGYFALEEKVSGALLGAAGLIRHFDWPETEMGWQLRKAPPPRRAMKRSSRLGSTTTPSSRRPSTSRAMDTAKRGTPWA